MGQLGAIRETPDTPPKQTVAARANTSGDTTAGAIVVDVPAGRRSGDNTATSRGDGGVFLGQRFPDLDIATPRLHVRRLTAADAKAVDAVFGDRLTRRWLPFPAEYGPIDGHAWCTSMASERRSMGSGDHYGVYRKEDDALIGCMWTKRTDWSARSTEVSYAIAPDARGFGFAAEAVDGLAIELLMRHDFHRIELRVAAGNTASRRVAEKAGFSFEGVLRNAGHVYNGRTDLQMWSLVAADLH